MIPCSVCGSEECWCNYEAPYVCPGCHAVAERCAPGCIDAAREREDDSREYEPTDEDDYCFVDHE